jgi:hypothetical protein
VTKTASLLGVSRVTVSKVMSSYTNRGKTSAKRNGGWKSASKERDHHTLRRIVSKNRRTVWEPPTLNQTLAIHSLGAIRCKATAS